MTREELANTVDSLKLSADIAQKAMHEDFKSCILDIVHDSATHEIDLIDQLQHYSSLPMVFDLLIKDIPGIYLRIICDKDKDMQRNKVKIWLVGCESTPIEANDSFGAKICFFDIVNAIMHNMYRINDFVNSVIFMSYEDDINAFSKAKKDIEQFDNDMRNKAIDDMISRFYAGMIIVDSNGKYHTILKVTKKRVYATEFICYNGHSSQSPPKHEVATWIVDGKWHEVQAN